MRKPPAKPMKKPSDDKQDAKMTSGMSPKQKSMFMKTDNKVDAKMKPTPSQDKKMDSALAARIRGKRK